jgi:HCOMODA/2-hydroxy-3-carboxy-muconic semialdehyde decarboxylase
MKITRREFMWTAASLAASTQVVARQTPSSAGPADPALVEDLIVANRVLAREGLVDAFGHVSVRHNADPDRYLLSRSLAPALVKESDIIEYDLDSNPVNAGNRAQYSERFIHGELYKARPDVRAIVHNHSSSVVVFGISSIPLKAVYHMGAFIGEGLPIFEIRDAAGMSEMLVNSPERGRAMGRSLGRRPAVLMRGHGVAVVGPSLPSAVGRSYYLELNARIQAQAMALGGKVTYLDAEEIRRIEAGEIRSYERPWEIWKQEVLAGR